MPSIAETAKQVIFSHPTGNANSRAVLGGLADASLLAEFRTTVATFPGNPWSMLAHTPLGRDFERRRFPEKVEPVTKQRPLREIGRMVASRAGLKRLTRHETGPLCVDSVYRDLDRQVAKRVAKQRFDAVYAYEDGAVESFRAAKQVGTKCLYDLPIGYWRAARELLSRERERWPEWSATLSGFRDSPDKLARKDEELRLADRIYVASEFTKQTLASYPERLAPIEVIPYGFPPAGPPREEAGLGQRKLKLLYVGGLSQRKGIADVFAVADRLRDEAELTVVGQGPVDACPALAAALERHRWIPSLPHHRVIELMRQHDLLLFPSLFEGFGLVITEAMSQGTPVITTDRTAGPNLIEHGVNGWLVEAGCTEALANQVEAILGEPASLATVGEAARRRAMTRPWDRYGRELAESVGDLLRSDP